MEFVHVPRRQEHFGIGLSDTVGVELHRVPGGSGGDHVPTRCVGAFPIEMVPRVDDVAARFRHLLSLGIQDQSE